MSSSINELISPSFKIVIAGPVGSGKTEAVRSLSDKPIVSTEEFASDEVKEMKQTTTVAMDYGVMKLDSGEQVRLYGTPGQKRFDFMWEILSENALGLILLLNAQSEDCEAELAEYLNSFRPLIDGSALVVGVTHCDCEDMQSDLHQRLTNYLLSQDVPANVMTVDAREREQMRQMVRSLIYAISD